MNAPKKPRSAATRKVVPSVVTASRPGLSVDISGTVPGLNRSQIRRWSRTILRHLKLKQAELSLAFVTDQTIHELNRQYRRKDRPTDVLSFPLADERCPTLLGDVVISVDTARRQARQRKRAFADELRALLIHGILHLLGYDHEVSDSEAVRMRRKERELKVLLQQFGDVGRIAP